MTDKVLDSFPADPSRPYKSFRISLGAYQNIKLIPANLGEYYTDGGKSPLTLLVQITSPMDKEFVNRTVSLLLSEKAQEDLIKALKFNLTNGLSNVKLAEEPYNELII